MGLWEEVMAFKEEHDLRFHPLHEKTNRKKVETMERNGRRCMCRPERTCVCEEALEECRTIGCCQCLLFVSKEYLQRYGYA